MGISVATDDAHFYAPIDHKPWGGFEFTNIRLPDDIFRVDPKTPCVFHYAGFDLSVLKKLGIKAPTGEVWDTMLMSHYIDENNQGYLKGHDLDTLSQRYLKERKKTELSKAMRDNWEQIPPYVMAKYAEADAYLTRDLYHVLLPLMKQAWIDQWINYDRPFAYLLMEITDLGLPIDRELCQRLANECEKRLWEIRQELGFDPAKPSQLHPRLFDPPPVGLGLTPSSRTPGGKPQVKLEWLQTVGHPVTALVYEYKKVSKELSSYYAKYLGATTRAYARLHPSIKQHGTVTGRLSGDLQQIPREGSVKSLFNPEDGKQLWEIDFKTIEYILACVYAQDHETLDLFNDGGDVHQLTANRMGISRFSAKQLNYITIMGGGVPAVMHELKCGFEKAKKYLSDYWSSNPKLADKIEEAENFATDNMEIDMWSGRTRHFQYASECRKAFNSVIQGGAFEIVKRSMLNLRFAGFDLISNQVHDSAWVNVDTEKDAIEAQHYMEDWTEEVFGVKFTTDRKLLKRWD